MVQTEVSGKPRSNRRRGAKRQSTDGAANKAALSQPAFKTLHRPTAPVEFLSQDEIMAIHNASLKVLSETGVDVLHDDARRLMGRAGAQVEEGSNRVRFDPELIKECLATIPPKFTLHARNPGHSVSIGGRNTIFDLMASAPNCSDLDNGRRPGSQADFRNLLKLAQSHNILHVTGGYPVEPVDIHASVRHLDCIQDYITLTDKAYCIYALGPERVEDAIEMTRIAHGLSHEELQKRACMFSIINTNSPLQLDIPMMDGVMRLAKMGQPVVVTPFTLSGAMAPVTIAGALVLQNAEALSAIALSQMVRPGAPVMYGGFTSNVDMKTGSPAFGTPEYMKAQHASGQLARLYGIPFRSSNVCAANTVDAQAAYEAVFSLWGAINGGANMLMHGAGWLEGGLCCSYEKLILDIDLLQMVGELLEPLEVNADTLATDVIASVGPAGHFFGTDHTQARYKDAFYSPILSDWRNFETWQEAGSPIAMEKANKVWKERLAEYQAPDFQVDRAEELSEFVAKRKAEGGAKTDF